MVANVRGHLDFFIASNIRAREREREKNAPPEARDQVAILETVLRDSRVASRRFDDS